MEDQKRWDLYNDFALWGGLDRFTKMLARYELYKLIVDKPGDIVEGGVLKGSGLMYWAKLIEIFNAETQRKVIGFDTFEGYPEGSAKSYDRVTAKYFKQIQIQNSQDVSVENIALIAEKQKLGRRVELVKGKAEDSMPDYVQKHPDLKIALLDLDFVLYEPTMASLKNLYPYVVPGGVVVLDEYRIPDVGETEAVDEYFAGEDLQLLSFPWAQSPTAYFLKAGLRG